MARSRHSQVRQGLLTAAGGGKRMDTGLEETVKWTRVA